MLNSIIHGGWRPDTEACRGRTVRQIQVAAQSAAVLPPPLAARSPYPDPVPPRTPRRSRSAGELPVDPSILHFRWLTVLGPAVCAGLSA